MVCGKYKKLQNLESKISFQTHYADEHPEGDILLSGAEIDANKHECILVIHGGKEQVKIVVR